MTSPHRYSVVYRGATLTRTRAGHVNVTRADGGFVGGFASEAAARRFIDARLDAPRVERIDRNTYRVVGA